MFAGLADRRWVFVDVETTGSSPARDRVTEVGVVTVETDGEAQRVAEWSSLVNPGVPIPPDIQWLTGISNEMVRDAPSFAELADMLYDRLADAVFVAHNARRTGGAPAPLALRSDARRARHPLHRGPLAPGQGPHRAPVAHAAGPSRR